MQSKTTKQLKLSVLDIGIIRSNQTSSQAFEAGIALAQKAESLGYSRYWLAEHHNVPATVASITTTYAGIIAAKTNSIKVGGCILQPHYSAFLIAEEAAILEGCFAERIDLAIGGAFGTDHATALLLQDGKRATQYTSWVEQLIKWTRSNSVKTEVKATPAAATTPSIWVWGTSRDQAIFAARLGLPFLFCYHIMGNAEIESIALYKEYFQPSEFLSAPKVALSAIVVVAKTEQEAQQLAKPQLRMMAEFRSGELSNAQLLVEEVDNLNFAPHHLALVDLFKETWIIGDPEQATLKIQQLAVSLGVDEVMINPVAGAYQQDDLSQSIHREFTLEALSSIIGKEMSEWDNKA